MLQSRAAWGGKKMANSTFQGFTLFSHTPRGEATSELLFLKSALCFLINLMHSHWWPLSFSSPLFQAQKPQRITRQGEAS